ncbi:hypothetical protein RSAG8_02335, partial [Rhizoctonia solani AG-8 WAC10335]
MRDAWRAMFNHAVHLYARGSVISQSTVHSKLLFYHIYHIYKCFRIPCPKASIP